MVASWEVGDQSRGDLHLADRDFVGSVRAESFLLAFLHHDGVADVMTDAKVSGGEVGFNREEVVSKVLDDIGAG